MIDANSIINAACKYLGRLYTDMDCQAFVEKALEDAGLYKNLGGSNSWFRAMTWVGTPSECKAKYGKIPTGAFLYILDHDGKEPEKFKNDGIGNVSHIGIYTAMTGKQMVSIAVADGVKDASKYNHGNGAIHSSESKKHVCTSNFSGRIINGGWNRVGLWNKITYDDQTNKILKDLSPDSDVIEVPDIVVAQATVFADVGTSVKMRQRPSKNCSVYWDVPIGETVDVYEFGDWDRIGWRGRIGYMRSEYVRKGETMSTIEPVINQKPNSIAVVIADGKTVKMRKEPSTKCSLYDDVAVGTIVTVLEKGETWSKIKYGIRNGWYMMTKFLKFEEE